MKPERRVINRSKSNLRDVDAQEIERLYRHTRGVWNACKFYNVRCGAGFLAHMDALDELLTERRGAEFVQELKRSIDNEP